MTASRTARWRHQALPFLLTIVAQMVWAPGPASPQAQTKDPLAPVAFLAGSRWLGEGKWPDGSAMRVDVRYFWGPTRRVLHFETHDIAAPSQPLLYEGLIFFDPKRGHIVQWNMKPDGDWSEFEVTHADSAGYEVKGDKTWSLVRYVNRNEFAWELRALQDTTWNRVMEARYQRKR